MTLYHWDLPQALDDLGGWLSRDIAGWFGDYTEAVVGALGDRVANWTTLNEPWCSSILSYSLAHHAPGHQDPIEGMIAAHHLMLAHGTAVPIIRDVAASKGTQAEVSITLNPSQVLGPPDPTAADLDAVRRADNVFNGLFFSPLFHGEYPNTMLEDIAHLAEPTWIHDGDLRTISAPLDNLGINNYFPTRVKATDPATNPTRQPGCEGMAADAPQGKLTDMGWEISPDAHRDILLRSWEESGLPIYVTENGSAWPDVVSEDGEVHDPDRTAYLHGHLAAVREAIDAGADIRGYFAWSLMDNFEWAFGYDKRFGIVHVDYDTQKRTIKDSALWFAELGPDEGARTRCVPGPSLRGRRRRCPGASRPRRGSRSRCCRHPGSAPFRPGGPPAFLGLDRAVARRILGVGPHRREDGSVPVGQLEAVQGSEGVVGPAERLEFGAAGDRCCRRPTRSRAPAPGCPSWPAT